MKEPKYSSWHGSEGSSLLWVTAKAGCGKTTVAAHVCQTISALESPTARILQENADSEPILLYFFFQRSNDKTLRTATAALRTIIHQLVCQVPEVLQILLKRHEFLSAKGAFDWSWENLSGVLETMLKQKYLSSGVCIVFDALDECETESLLQILDWINFVVDENVAPISLQGFRAVLKILVTSRPDGAWSDHLSHFPTLDITEADTFSDIRSLIHNRINDFAVRRRLKSDTSKRMVEFLESNAHGMFIWVVLIMEELERRDERLSDESISHKLSSVPLTLAGTYASIIRNVPPTRKQDFWRIIRWMLFENRTLTLRELETALCLETNNSSWHDFAGDMQFLCGSLIRLHGPFERVEFVHQTARGFLETFIHDSNPAEFNTMNMNPQAANEDLATTCLRYLLRDEMFAGLGGRLSRMRTVSAYAELLQDLLDQNNFLCYAIESWDFHTRAAGAPSPALSSLVCMLLSSQSRRDDIITLTYFIIKPGGWNSPVGRTSLHLAAYFNISWLVKMHLSDKISANIMGGGDDTPLIWASEMGSTESVEALLEAGADPNMCEYDGWSPLHWAARNGHVAVARLLLEHGASLTHQHESGHMPLDWAKDREHWDIVDLMESCSGVREGVPRRSPLRTGRTHSLPDVRDFWVHAWQRPSMPHTGNAKGPY